MLAQLKRHRLALFILALVAIGVTCLVVGLTARSGPASSSVSQSVKPVPLDDEPSKTTDATVETKAQVQSDIEQDAAALQAPDTPLPPANDQKVRDDGATLASAVADSSEIGSVAVDDIAILTASDAEIKPNDDVVAGDHAKNANDDDNVKVETDEASHGDDAQAAAVQKEVVLGDKGEESNHENLSGNHDDVKDDNVQADHQPDQTGEHESESTDDLVDSTSLDGDDDKAAVDEPAVSDEGRESNSAHIEVEIKPDDVLADNDTHHHGNESTEVMTSPDAAPGHCNEDSDRADDDDEEKPAANDDDNDDPGDDNDDQDDDNDDHDGGATAAVDILSQEDFHTAAPESPTVTSRELDCASDSEFHDAVSQGFGEPVNEDASSLSYESAESEIQGSDGNESPRLSSADLTAVNEDPSAVISSEDITSDLSSNMLALAAMDATTVESTDVVKEFELESAPQFCVVDAISCAIPIVSEPHTDGQLESNEAPAASSSSENSVSQPDDCGNDQVSDREYLPSDDQSIECLSTTNPKQPMSEATTSDDLVSCGMTAEAFALLEVPAETHASAASSDEAVAAESSNRDHCPDNAQISYEVGETSASSSKPHDRAYDVTVFIVDRLRDQAGPVQNIIDKMWDWLTEHRLEIESVDLSHFVNLYEQLVNAINTNGVTAEELLEKANFHNQRMKSTDDPKTLPYSQFPLAPAFVKLAEMHQALFQHRRPLSDLRTECFLCADDKSEVPSLPALGCWLSPAVDSPRSDQPFVYCCNTKGCGSKFHRHCFLNALVGANPELPAHCPKCGILWAGTPDFVRDDNFDID